MRELKFILLVVLAISIVSPRIAFAPPADPDVVVPLLQNPVNLDGAIIGDEWSDAEMLPVTFDFYDDFSTYMGISRWGEIYLKHDGENLWICIVVEDPIEDADAWVSVDYDVSGDGNVLNSGDDEKGMFHPDNPFDLAIINAPPSWDDDTNLGGSKDILGESGWASQTLTFEFAHPLNSGDSNGNDPALEPGDSILAMFLVGDPDIPGSSYGWGGQYDLVLAHATFYVPVLLNPVTLDGAITGDEWADAAETDVTFERDGLTYEGTIYLKHDRTNLWMCIQVLDDDEESSPGPGFYGDLVGVIFDANGNNMTDASDDMAGLSHDDYPMDLAYTAEPPASPEEDDAIGGVMNVLGESEYDVVEGLYTFELSKPLNSGDSAGNDIAISPGDEILTMFIYHDPGETPEAPPFVGFSLTLETCARTVGEVGDRIFNALENSVYYVPTGNIYDDSAFYAFYWYKTNPQIIAPPTQSSASSAFLDVDGSPLFTGDIVTFGGRYANRLVAYYEDAGVAKVGFLNNGTHRIFRRISDGEHLYAVDFSTYNESEKDYFVIQAYGDGARYVLSMWGIRAPGTYAGGTCFIDIVCPNIQDCTDQYYIFSWTDSNSDGMPQPDEITLETSGS